MARGRSAPDALVVAHLMGRLSSAGGVQKVVRRLASAADPAVVDLHVVTMRPQWDDVDGLALTLHPGGFSGNRYRLRDRALIVGRQALEAARIRPDVLHLHSGTAWLGLLALLVRPRTPVVLEVHDAPGSGRHAGSTDRLETALIRSGRAHAVCHSSPVEQDLVDAGVPRDRITRFPLGVETDEFVPLPEERRQSWRLERGLAPGTMVAVAIGRSAAFKRLDLLIEAIADLHDDGRDVALVLIGPDGESELRDVARRRGIDDSVHFPGFVDDLAEAIASCDVLCSASEYEGFGLTLAEGMSCGLPVVATAVGGVPDVVADGTTGLLVPAGDQAAFAQWLGELADDPAFRATLGVAGRRRAVDLFSLSATARGFESVYARLAGTESGRR